MDNFKNIVVLGGGFGGLGVVLKLAKEIKKLGLKEYKITLIDRYDHHTFTPLLYEIATTSKETADYSELKSLVSYPFSEILAGHDITILKEEVLHIDVSDMKVHLKNNKLPFDYLVLALGSETNYFNIPGLKEHSFALKSFDNAIAIRDALWFASESDKMIKVVIGGGGSTGVELAAEIKELFCKVVEEEKRCRVNVQIIEAAPTLLPMFGESIRDRVLSRINELGIGALCNERIKKVEEKKIILDSGKIINYDILVWTGGIKASSLTEKMPMEKEEKGRVKIVGDLECLPEGADLKVIGRVYALGDITCVINSETGKPMPAVARVAIDEGEIVSRNIIERIKEEKGLILKAKKSFYEPPREYPYIIPTGGKSAVAKVGSLIISGFLGWVLKGLVELNYLVSIMPPWKALTLWFKGLKIFIKNDNLG
ncbi:MAG: FAD-dependent oxidoreductase [Patescibacteria group bacterium]